MNDLNDLAARATAWLCGLGPEEWALAGLSLAVLVLLWLVRLLARANHCTGKLATEALRCLRETQTAALSELRMVVESFNAPEE